MMRDIMTTCAFKIVQIYSDRHGADLASEAAGKLKQEFDPSDCLDTSWNTELLRSPKLRLQAAREAAEADLVIMAADEGGPVSPEVRQWLELWARRKRRRRSTLMALLRRRDNSIWHVLETTLHAFAIAAGMDFFCHSRVETKNRRASTKEVLH
jgi:hypothetical protein